MKMKQHSRRLLSALLALVLLVSISPAVFAAEADTNPAEPAAISGQPVGEGAAPAAGNSGTGSPVPASSDVGNPAPVTPAAAVPQLLTTDTQAPQVIEQIVLTVPEELKTAECPVTDIPVAAADAPYTISYSWIEKDGESVNLLSDTPLQSGVYTLQFTAAPKEGYVFADNAQLQVSVDGNDRSYNRDGQDHVTFVTSLNLKNDPITAIAAVMLTLPDEVKNATTAIT